MSEAEFVLDRSCPRVCLAYIILSCRSEIDDSLICSNESR